jgi:hypothetical protein
MSEADLQHAVTDIAAVYGWSWVHHRPAQTSHGWRTPVSGPMGKGWPDICFARPGRFLVAELKAAGAKCTPEQAAVHEILRAAGVEVKVWWPKDLDNGAILEALR